VHAKSHVVSSPWPPSQREDCTYRWVQDPKVKVLWGSSVPLGGSAPPTVICMNLDFGNHGVKTDRSLSSNVLEVVREARLSCLPRVALNCGIEAAK